MSYSLMLAALLGFISITVVRSETTTPILEHQWETGFKMNIRLQLLEKVTGGWNMTLRFTKPAPGLQIWRAKIVSVSNDTKVYELMNMPWNPDLEKCSILKMAFRAEKLDYDTPAPEAFVEFRRINGSNSELDTAACSPTTSPVPKRVVRSETTTPILEHQWETGFKMNIRLQLLEKVTGGWNMTLRFTKPAPGLQIWRAKIVSVSNDTKVYELMNMPWNPDLEKCSILKMAFRAEKLDYDTPAPEAFVEFRRINGSNSELDTAACSPTTSPVPKRVVRSETTTPILEHQWETGFKMNIRLQLLEKVTGGWNMTLRFTKPAPGLQIWRAKIVSVSNDTKVYELMNMPWNPDLEKCSILKMAFRADKLDYDTPAPEAFVVFRRINGSNSELDTAACSPTTSSPRTTSSPTTTVSITQTTTRNPFIPGSRSAGQTTNATIVDNWNIGFKMIFRFLIKQAVKEGWMIKIKFSKPALNLEIWRAEIVSVSSDNKTYLVKNMPFNKMLAKCTVLEIGFIAYKKLNDAAPDAEITFYRNGLPVPTSDNMICATTTSPPTTTAATTTTYTKPTTQATTRKPFTLGPLVAEQSTNAAIVDDWNTGFKMVFRFLMKQPVNEGWIIRIKFSKPALNLEIWKAEIVSVSSDKKTYFVRNMPFNKFLAKCTVLEIDFMAKKENDGDAAPEAEITFYRNGSPVPTSDNTICATTTKSPSTTSPSTRVTTKPATNAPSTVSPPSSSQPTTHQTMYPPTTVQRETTTSKSGTPMTSTAATASPSPYDYNKVLHASILFYEAQRSGKLPATNRVPWRGDSALLDRGDNGEDLTGGWYDAGDFVKFGFPMAASVTVLAWGLVEYRDAYKAAGELVDALDSIKWATDYFIKAHTAKFEFYGQVGDGDVDHAYWGRPEDMTMKRPGFKITTSKPGSELAAETAAALAAASIAFAQTKQTYASTLVKHAEELYEFADKYRGKYSDSIPNAATFYKSYSGFNDELVWGAAWLYKATKKQAYLEKAERYYTQYGMNSKPWAFSWDDKKAGAQVLLAEITGKASYKKDAQTYLDSWLPGGDVHYTPKGLAWRVKWGPNRYSANTAFLALVAADMGIKPQAYRDFARKQIHYMLGDSGRSFVVGFGVNPPLRPHHASSSCPSKPATCTWNDFKNPSPNPQTLTGALVGGPDKNDHYEDKRSDYVQNEVTTDYNAGFQSAIAGLKDLEMVV